MAVRLTMSDSMAVRLSMSDSMAVRLTMSDSIAAQEDTVVGYLADCLAGGLPVDVDRFVQQAQINADVAHAITAGISLLYP
jgi:hypothetical protein